MSESSDSSYASQSLFRSVYGPSLLHAAGYGMLVPAIPLFAAKLEVSIALIGALMAVQGVFQMGVNVPAGLLVTRSRFRSPRGLAKCSPK